MMIGGLARPTRPESVQLRPEMVGFDVASLPSHVILQLTRGGVERITDCNGNFLVLFVLGRFASRDNFTARQRDINVHCELIPMDVVLAHRLDHYAAARDAAGESVEPGRSLPNRGLDSRRMHHVPEGDLQGKLHRGLSFDFDDPKIG
jgi:hypothetical protein